MAASSSKAKACKLCKYTKLVTILDQTIPYCEKCVARFYKGDIFAEETHIIQCNFMLGCDEMSRNIFGKACGFCINHLELIKKYTTKRAYFIPHDIEFSHVRVGRCCYTYTTDTLGYKKSSSCPGYISTVIDRVDGSVAGYCTYHGYEMRAIDDLIRKTHKFFAWMTKLTSAKDDGSKEEIGYGGKMYKGEQAAKTLLESRYGVEFVKTRKLPFLQKASVNGRALEIDLYNDFLQLGVEVQGAQHEESIDFSGSGVGSDVKTQKSNDEIKRKLCKDNGVHLIRLKWSANWRGMQDELSELLDKFDKNNEKVIMLKLKRLKDQH